MPTVAQALRWAEALLAELEQGAAALTFGSGHAAAAAVFQWPAISGVGQLNHIPQMGTDFLPRLSLCSQWPLW